MTPSILLTNNFKHKFKLNNFKLLVISFGICFMILMSNSNAFAVSNSIITPNSWVSPSGQYPSSYNSTTGNTSFSNLPSGSNPIGPNTQSCSNGYGFNGYNNSTRNFNCVQFPTSFSNSIFIPSVFNYIIFSNSTGYYAINGQTGHIDYSGNDLGYIINNEAFLSYPNPSTGFIKCGNYNLLSQIQLWKSQSLYGEGSDCTIIKRGFNATIPQMIRATSNYQGYNGFTELRGFTIDGNYGHSNATLEISITGNGLVDDVKAINYNGIALEADNNVSIDHYTAIGVSSPTQGSIEGLWTSIGSRVTITNSDFENNRWGGIFAQGNTTISSSFFSHNHCQTSPVGGGQIALVNGGLVLGNIIVNGCGFATSGIETNYGNYIITDNIVSGNQNYGIATNGEISTMIIGNNFLKGNGHAISSSGSAIILNSNNSQ